MDHFRSRIRHYDHQYYRRRPKSSGQEDCSQTSQNWKGHLCQSPPRTYSHQVKGKYYKRRFSLDGARTVWKFQKFSTTYCLINFDKVLQSIRFWGEPTFNWFHVKSKDRKILEFLHCVNVKQKKKSKLPFLLIFLFKRFFEYIMA